MTRTPTKRTPLFIETASSGPRTLTFGPFQHHEVVQNSFCKEEQPSNKDHIMSLEGVLTMAHMKYGQCIFAFWALRRFGAINLPALGSLPSRILKWARATLGPQKHKDPRNHDFWYPPFIGLGTRT